LICRVKHLASVIHHHVQFSRATHTMLALCASRSQVDVCLITNKRLDVEGHDYRTTSPLSVVSARPGYMDARFSVKPEHCM